MKTFKTLNNKALAWIKFAVFLLALIPMFKLVSDAYFDNLGANPIEKITHSTGYWALAFILITLTITPLRRFSGWNWLQRFRRMLGLYAFFYASLHFLTYLALDQFFDWTSIVNDIVKRPYITVGFAAFLLLIPLAITSNNRIIKRMGGKQWLLLHRTVYVCAVGGVIHYWWLVKKDITNPLTFAILLGILLGIRLFYWLRGLHKSRAGFWNFA